MSLNAFNRSVLLVETWRAICELGQHPNFKPHIRGLELNSGNYLFTTDTK